MLFTLMFEEVPRKFAKDASKLHRQVRHFDTMLRMLNHIMTRAPAFDKSGLVGFPINALFDYSMGTTSGYAAFLKTKVNKQLKVILNEWAVFLGSPDSCYVLSTDPHSGWFGTAAHKKMFPGDESVKFEDVFQCNPALPYHGYKSWDDFFTRQFVPGRRPIASPHDDNVIVNACESAPYRIARGVKRSDHFWIKGQPYSVRHMLNNDSFVDHFVGGTIYQAFLSALSYHRWHSPVSGKIVKSYVIDGTYYSEAQSAGFDDCAPNGSQGYITEVATRGLIFIQADNADIGLMCFIAVGMAEVSTCQITVYEGQHVMKGDQLGMFHFGGSTHCLLFGPDVQLDFDMHGFTPGLGDAGALTTNIPVLSRIATVLPRSNSSSSSSSSSSS